MKVLNLYAGIGGNRKLWTDVEIVAVEDNESIAKIYQDFFPDDKMIITDAHQYLLEHFKEYDFIWSSPPCQSHTKINLINISRGFHNPKYIEMALYQEILLLKSFFNGKYCIENVISYYEPIIIPQLSGLHYYWANFIIPNIKAKRTKIASFKNKNVTGDEIAKGHNIIVNDWHNFKGNKDQIINNCVEPETGLHILECARGNYNYLKQKQVEIFNKRG